MFNIMICSLIFPPSFSFLLGTCFNENNDKLSRTLEIRENALVIRLSTKHVRTFKQWNMTQKQFKNAKLCSIFRIRERFNA